MKNYKESDKNHHLSPFANWKELNDEGGRRIIQNAEGVYIWDEDGKKFIDGMSGLWCVNMGYSCAPIIEAIHKQMTQLPYYNTFFKTSHPPAAELSALLAEVTPENIDFFFYNSSGSEANDTIYRLIRYYYDVLGKKQKKFFISRKKAYHGSTVWSASLGGMDAMRKQIDDDFKKPFIHIEAPYTYEAGKKFNDPEFGLHAARLLETEINRIGAENIAAFVGEPIQGAGGLIMPPDNYWREIRRICDQYDILLVSDEVICGFGRTGQWFGCQSYGITPDLMTMAKGISSGYLPLSAVGLSNKIANVICSNDAEFVHGYTYSGHPAACAAAIANLNFIKENKIVEKVERESAPYLSDALKPFIDHPLIGEVRSYGMLAAFELTKNKENRERWKAEAGIICRDNCLEAGVIIRACEQTMVMAPPLISTREEIDEMLAKAKSAFDKTYEDLKNLD